MTSRTLLALLGGAFAIILGVWIPLATRSRADLTVALAVCVLITCATPIVTRLIHNDLDWLEPVVPGVVMLAILFGVRPLYDVRDSNFDYLGYNIASEYPLAVAMGLVGTMAFVAGYEVAAVKRRARSAPLVTRLTHRMAASGSSIFTLAIVLSVGGAVLFVLDLLARGPLQYSLQLWLNGRSTEFFSASTSQYLSAGPILAACGAIATAAVSRWLLSTPQKVLVVFLALLPVVVFFFGGERRFIVPSITVPMVLYYLATGRRPGRRIVLAIAPVAFVLLVTIPYLRSSGARDQAGGVLPIVMDSISAPFAAWDRFITSYDTEMTGALSVEIQILRQPDDFFYGRATFGDLLMAPIPSALFPDKPITARNEILTRAYGTPCVTTGGVCPDSTALGTFYEDFSWFGVATGMAALGAFSRRIWERFLSDATSPTRAIVAATWIVLLPITLRAGWSVGIVWWLFFVIPSTALVVIARAMDGSRLNVCDPDWTGHVGRESLGQGNREV